MAADGGYGAKIGFDSSVSDRKTGEDFPMLCETCLGPNPFVRMVKTPFGRKLCKISKRPYQGFRWKAGPQGRYKETIICREVAEEKNICQTCLNDMQYGLPVGVRDSLLSKNSRQVAAPQSDVGASVFYSQQTREYAAGHDTQNPYINDLKNISSSRQLESFSRSLEMNRTESTSFRNLPKLCSFWLNGTCTRVTKKVCPFRPCCGTFVFPELAATHRDLMLKLIEKLKLDGPAAVQKVIDSETKAAFRDAMKGNRDDSIRKRVHGNDDLTRRYIRKMNAAQMESIPPEDTTVCTLWVGNLSHETAEKDIRDVFYPYGHIVNIHIVRPSNCCFIEYSSRAEAELAAKQLYNALHINGRSLSLNWAKPKSQVFTEGERRSSSTATSGLLPPPPGMEYAERSAYALPGMPAPVLSTVNEVVEAPLKKQRTDCSPSYPSVNPNQLGSKY